MRRLSILTFTAVLAMALIGCTPTANTNVKTNGNMMNANANVAVVVPNNSNMAANTGMTNSMMNANMSRADYDKDRAKYETDKGSSTIGTGANDSWIWFKTRAALTAASDLRGRTINVDVANDKITLKGTVATADQKAKAEELAKGIDGQKGVTNMLKVDPNDSLTNQMTSGNDNTKMTNANMMKKK